MYSNPFVSIIICSYNRAGLLKQALHSLTQQSYNRKHYEIIVVDDGSEDNTFNVCDDLCSELPNLKYISTGANNGVANARNIGFKAARGNYILFIDDDCIAAKNWVEQMVNALKREAIVTGVLVSTFTNYFKLCHNIAQFHNFMPGQKKGPNEFIIGANMGFKRSVLEELNGFNTYLSTSEDMEFILRARMKGYRIFFVPDAVITHDPERKTLSDIINYSVKHACNSILLRNKYRSLLRTPFVLCSPSSILTAAPLIALKVTVSIYLCNFSMLKFFWTAPVVFILKLAWCWGAASGLRKYNREKGKI